MRLRSSLDQRQGERYRVGDAAGGVVEDEVQRTRAEAVPRWSRWFVRVFVGVFVLCGVAGIEAWPLTGFRLFSHLRHEQTVGWLRTWVGPDGSERPVDLTGLPQGYGSFVLVVTSFASRPKHEQDAMCRAWISGLARVDPTVQAMRVYRLDQSLAPRRDGRPATSPLKSLVFVCTDHGVVEPDRTGGGS
jgi:hypothetical protein